MPGSLICEGGATLIEFDAGSGAGEWTNVPAAGRAGETTWAVSKPRVPSGAAAGAEFIAIGTEGASPGGVVLGASGRIASGRSAAGGGASTVATGAGRLVSLAASGSAWADAIGLGIGGGRIRQAGGNGQAGSVTRRKESSYADFFSTSSKQLRAAESSLSISCER